MKKARYIGSESLQVAGTIIHIERSASAYHYEWMERNGLQETETVETAAGEKFKVWANWARHLACAIPA